MQQQIGFCSTADGVRIAYATVGSGPAMVVAEPRFSNIGLEWEEPRVRDFWETIGHHHMVVRYDVHGCGLATLLTGSIRTGTFCSYTPDSRLPACWQL
jgi:hypothetical protein